MPFLNLGRSGTALLWSGLTTNLPTGVEIGTGSSTKTVGTTGLTTPVLFQAFTSAPDYSTLQQVTYESDFSSTQLSGLSINEIAVKKSGGSYWSADGFPSITFDGSLEMAVIVSWVIF